VRESKSAERLEVGVRLVTRGDLDGLVCAVVASTHEKIEEIVLVHPQDITDRKVVVTGNDILANLPYDPRCGKWFDHHLLTENNERPPAGFDGKFGIAPSAAHLVWEYYGKDPRFEKLVSETDRLDAALLTREDVLSPSGYILFGYTIDGRSGLASYEDYFQKCVGWVKELPIEEVLEKPEVAHLVGRLKNETESFLHTMKAVSELRENVIFTDLRPLDEIPAGNRFLIYTLFPTANVSLRVHWGPDKKFVVAAVGHSIFNRTCRTNLSLLMSRYGGGGHAGAATTPLPPFGANEAIEDILEELIKNG
jgi:oligoribonuclease NrnB/cAMP/cGMP phosphodiesterase (DHH superfamily)